MGQVEPSFDLRIAIQVHMEPVDIEYDLTGPRTWRQAMLLGTVELGQVPQAKGNLLYISRLASNGAHSTEGPRGGS